MQQDIWGLDDWDAERASKAYGKKFVPCMGVMQHINECVNEMCAIMRSVSAKGTESFDLPKLSEQPEGLDMRRRDRWSALMLANYAAKVFMGTGHRPVQTLPKTRTSAGRGYTNRGRRRGSAAY